MSHPILVRDASPAQTALWDGRSSAASAMRAEDEEGVWCRSINQGVSRSIYLEARGRGPSPLSDAGAPRALIGWTDGVPLHQNGSLPPPPPPFLCTFAWFGEHRLHVSCFWEEPGGLDESKKKGLILQSQPSQPPPPPKLLSHLIQRLRVGGGGGSGPHFRVLDE